MGTIRLQNSSRNQTEAIYISIEIERGNCAIILYTNSQLWSLQNKGLWLAQQLFIYSNHLICLTQTVPQHKLSINNFFNLKKPAVYIFSVHFLKTISLHIPGETENEWQKTEPVPISLLRGARSFFDAKKMQKKILLAWTSEIIQFIRYPIQMDRTERSKFFGGKGWLFIVIQFAIMGYGHFPTRNGLELRKLSSWH